MRSSTNLFGGTLLRINVAGNGPRIVSIHFKDKGGARNAFSKIQQSWSSNNLKFKLSKEHEWSEKISERLYSTQFTVPEDVVIEEAIIVDPGDYSNEHAILASGSQGFYIVISCGITFGP